MGYGRTKRISSESVTEELAGGPHHTKSPSTPQKLELVVITMKN